MSDLTKVFNFEFIGDLIRPDYRTLPKNIRVGLYAIQRGRFSYVNTNSCRILGFNDPQTLIGMSLWQLVHPKDRHLVRLRHSDKRMPVTDSDPFRMIKRNGDTIWVAMQGKNTIVSGKPANLGYLIDMRSIRYIKRAMAKYRSRITLVEDVVAEIDLKGNIRSYSQSAAEMWGICGSEMVDKNYRTVMDKASAKIVREAYHKVYETGLPCSNIIYEIFRKDGHRRIVEDSVTLIRDNSGSPKGFRMVSRDITRQKETERQSAKQNALLEAIFSNVHDGIITVDPEFKIIDANTPMQTICGVDLSDATGEYLPELLKHCSAMCCRVLQKTLMDKANIDNFLIECKHENNPRQIVNVCSSALLHPNDKFMGAVLVIRDETRRHDLERELRPRYNFHQLVSKSKKMHEIYSLMEELADLDTTVLITGESGTGKSLAARALHDAGRRSDKPFITVNCSALAESLLESELFGHTKGAFTGAIANKKGRFETAEGGTIVLDEIGDISQLIQLKLLRVLQEKEIERVGETTTRKVNVRVIACTNKDLKQKVKTGDFREDLYYRLKVVEMTMPALRERPEDVPLLIEHFSLKLNKRLNKTIQGVSSDALTKLMDYNWPGNVRELEHTLERAFILCSDSQITASHLPPEVRTHKISSPEEPAASKIDNAQKIRDALNKAFWNKTQAAQLLGISRQTLYRKIRTYKLTD